MSGWNGNGLNGRKKDNDHNNNKSGDSAQYDPSSHLFTDGSYERYNHEYYHQGTSQNTANHMYYHVTNPPGGPSGHVFNSSSVPYGVGMQPIPMYTLQQPSETDADGLYTTLHAQQNITTRQIQESEPTSALPQTYGHYHTNPSLGDIAKEYANSYFGDNLQQSNEVSGTVASLISLPPSQEKSCSSNSKSGGDDQTKAGNMLDIIKPENDKIIKDLILSIPSLSLKPLTATEVLERVDLKSREVVTRYLPCVNFLVMCQQELRTALLVANQRRNGRGYKNGMSTEQFYKTYLEPLPTFFFGQNQFIMKASDLNTAYEGIISLLHDSKRVEKSEKCEGMKNAFLGGMRDGESWGLRKWLSKNGGALQICNDLELILGAVKKLPRDSSSSIHLAKRIRPIAKQSYDKLINDVPKAYQEISSAHPYLPFFHRLDSVLKGLSEYDPEDDDVICLDDESDDDTNVNETSKCSNNDQTVEKKSAEKPSTSKLSPNDALCLEDEDKDIVVGLRSSKPNVSSENNSKEVVDADRASISVDDNATKHRFQMQTAQDLAATVDDIAVSLEKGIDVRPTGMDLSDFWTHPCSNYIILLRAFQKVLLSNSSHPLLHPPVSDDMLKGSNQYYQMIKNPLCFRDIIDALSIEEKGQLKCPNLKRWNMFGGTYLIQAIDLVFLNTLAYLGKGSNCRNNILSLRNSFWAEIRSFAGNDKKNIPVKRKEESSFVIRKYNT